MASDEKYPGAEYARVKTKRGEIETMSIVLYNPKDGDTFIMPQGGSPLTYIARGYMMKPDAAWHAKHAELVEAKAQSLKVSNFQREIKHRAIEVERVKEVNRINAEMELVEAEMAKAEAALVAGSTSSPTVAPAPDFDNMTKAEIIEANPGAGLDMTMTKDTMIAEIDNDDKPPFED